MILFLTGCIEFRMYAEFNKQNQTITFSYPLVMSQNGSFQGQVSDTASVPSYTWATDSNTGFFHPQNDNIGVATNGSEVMRFASNGNIGIGTTNPLGKLHVHGSSQSVVVTGAGNVGIGTIMPTAGFAMQVQGYCLVSLPVAILEEKYAFNLSSILYANGITNSTAPTTVNTNSWRVRRLNTYVYPQASDHVRSFVTFTPGDYSFSLTPGTYHVHAEATGIAVGRHRIALTSAVGVADVNTPTIVIAGSSEFTFPIAASDITSYVNGTSTATFTNMSSSKTTLSGIFQVTNASSLYRIQHFTNQPDTIGVFGIPAVSGTDDTYLRVIITRYQ